MTKPIPRDPITGPRPSNCGNDHPPEFSVRRWRPSGWRWCWVCQQCDRERMAKLWRSDPQAQERQKVASAKSRRRSAEMSKLSGFPPPWKPGLGHCEFRGAPQGFIEKPDPREGSDSWEIIEKYCTGCPVARSCLRWAEKQPMFVGIAGGQMFGLQDKEESGAA